MKQGRKFKQLLPWTAVAAALCLLGYALIYALPYMRAKNAMAADTYFTLTARADGGAALSWTASADCDGYFVTVFSPDGEPLARGDTTAPEWTLPPTDTATLRITVNSWKQFSRFGKTERRLGRAAAELTCALSAPRLNDLRLLPDPDTRTARLLWESADSDTVLLRAALAGESRELGTYAEDSALLRFDGAAEAIRMPEYGEQCLISARAYREGENYIFYAEQDETAVLEREALLGRDLQLECSDLGNNRYRLSWAETKGNYYAVQRLDASGDWQTLAEIDRTGERSYDTGRYTPFTEHDLRVVAMGGDTLPESDRATEPAEVRITTAESVLYASVWPLKELELYADPARKTLLGRVPAAACCCVLGEEAGMLLVRWADLRGYIDGNYCLINLPDYIGALCSYDIRNSYDSLYMVHEFEIPKVTATVVEGYEHVKTGEGTYLAPLLYPTAKKLIPAARAALADGLRLKIYDSYRPNRATRSIYDLTQLILHKPVPTRPFTETLLKDLDLPKLSADEGPLNYYRLMTDGTYSLGNFLASQGSFHNMGIALDLTLEQTEDGAELEMQTRMHDLSHYSALSRNNDNAKRLSAYMLGAGFGGLGSEWWHFQDNEIRAALNLNIFMWEGISPEGWTADDTGWRYRDADGSDKRDCELTLGAQTYRFDAAGYLVTAADEAEIE